MTPEIDRLTQAARKVARHAAEREELHAAILAALDSGIRQADIVRLSGYTRERIRQLDIARRQP